jgi:hypothetical protein
MAGKLGPKEGGLGSRRLGHRFVVVVYGDTDETEQAWPGHVVHVPTTVDAEPEIRVAFAQVERLPGILRQLIDNVRPAKARPPTARNAG